MSYALSRTDQLFAFHRLNPLSARGYGRESVITWRKSDTRLVRRPRSFQRTVNLAATSQKIDAVREAGNRQTTRKSLPRKRRTACSCSVESRSQERRHRFAETNSRRWNSRMWQHFATEFGAQTRMRVRTPPAFVKFAWLQMGAPIMPLHLVADACVSFVDGVSVGLFKNIRYFLSLSFSV